MNKKILLFLCFTIFLVVCSYSVFAATFNVTVIPISVDEEISYLYNFTITNTNITANITQVNITLPSDFSVSSPETNGTSVSGATFSIISSVLSWNNTPLIENGSIAYFWFNTTATVPGTYNFSVTTLDTSSVSVSNESNIVTVNDTSNPTSTLTSPANNSYDKESTIFICSASDNVGLSALKLYIWNSSNDLNMTNTTSVSGTTNTTNWTITLSVEGSYTWNCLANDTVNNQDWNINRTITIDNTAPTQVTLTSSSSTRDSLILIINVSDALSGIGSSCSVDRSGASISGTGVSQTLTEINLNCGNSYSYTVTCSDRAGNSNASSATSFSTDSCGGGSGGVTPSFWSNTFVINDNQFKQGATRIIVIKERMKITIENKVHYLGLVELTGTTATINISSTPQQAILSIGDMRRFDVTDDGYYDIAVTLNSIVDNKADIKIISIYEEITEETIAEEEDKEKAVIEVEEKKNLIWLWVSIIAVIVFVGLAMWLKKRKK